MYTHTVEFETHYLQTLSAAEPSNTTNKALYKTIITII